MKVYFYNFCRLLTSYYVRVKTTLKKKEIGFYLEAYPIGIPCELIYRDGILSELKQDSVRKCYQNYLTSVLFNHIKNCGLIGIPLKLHERVDATFRGIITLNKHRLINYICSTNLYNIIIDEITNKRNYPGKTWCIDDWIPNSVFYNNLLTLLDLEKDVCAPGGEEDWNNDYNDYMVYLFIKLMYDVPDLTGFIYPKTKQYMNTHDIQRKDLFEFVVFDHQITHTITRTDTLTDFIFCSNKIRYEEEKKICDIFFESAKERKKIKRLDDILILTRALAMDEIEFLYLKDWSLVLDEVNKRDLVKKIPTACVKLGFDFNQLFHSLIGNKNSLSLQIINSALKHHESIENAITNFLKIPLFLENSSVLGNLGETLTDFHFLIMGCIPIKRIDVNKSSNNHGIDHIYERINPKTNKKEWLIVESKVNTSTLSDVQCTEKWVMGNLLAALVDPEKATEISFEYTKDNTCIKVFYITYNINSLQDILKNALFKTVIPTVIGQLDRNAVVTRQKKFDGNIPTNPFLPEIFEGFINP